ncbi:hypothetical protein PYCCODRAFT_1464101 [Trametes coccinea BRFM310]|uniref:Uncharacterized protein n=1 Tax=Trametes coccinea (strain BRFM310) TaxID=1353009 RepID=A0A1Y2J444_TRAC3|nr:hypothetical protein PYCCODRAFT_1464101 [Trametes coccinea BRFM310]
MQPASSSSSTVVSPGTKEYLPDLFARARAAHPDLPLDPVILQSLLICLIAQTRSTSVIEKQAQDRPVRPGLHLILRTREEDVGLVVNLAALTLQHILGVSTHKHKVSQRSTQLPSQRRRPNGVPQSSRQAAPAEDTDAFLRALFFRRPTYTSMSSHRSTTPRPRSGISLDATPRSGTIPLAGQAKSPRAVGHAPHRSASYPAVPASDGEDEEQYFDASSLASSRRPLLSGHTPASTVRSRGSSRGRPSAHRLRTDPLPLSALFAPPGIPSQPETQVPPAPVTTSPESMRPQKSDPVGERTSEAGQPITALPKAVVVSGLENTTMSAQRALMKVLTERRLIVDASGNAEDDTDTVRDPDDDDGTWNLPEGFVMVYVCKWDPYERPAILRGLLDKFSMSADIALAPALRQNYLAYRAAHTPTPRGTPLPSPLALPHSIHSSFFPNQSQAHHSPVRRNTPLPAPTPQSPPVMSASELTYLRTLARPYPVTGPIFYPSVHATVTALRVSPLPEQSPPCAVLHPSLDMYLLDLFAATRHHPALDGTLLTQRAHADAEALARAFRVLNGDTLGTTLISHEANVGEKEAATADSFDEESWTEDGWRSAESLAGSARANGFAKRRYSDEYGGVNGVRLHVNGAPSDSSSRRSAAYDDLASLEGGLIPHEAQAVAMARAWPERWDVSEEDVARIFPRVVSHRLRVRNGPDDEVLGSVMWPAAAPEGGQGAAATCGVEDSPEVGGPEGTGTVGWDRKTVKEILVRVLADV